VQPPPARKAFDDGAVLADALAEGSSSGGGGGGGGVTSTFGGSDITPVVLADGCGERISVNFPTTKAAAIKSMTTAARTYDPLEPLGVLEGKSLAIEIPNSVR